MYNGKFKHRKRRLRWSKQFVLLVSVATLVVGVIGGSLAYLFTNTEPVVNKFTPGNVDITVQEEFNDNVKNNVTIKNTGNVNAVIRARIVVTWQAADGSIYPAKPVVGTDYTITWTMDGWTGPDADGWYTHSAAVAPGANTGVWFTQCQPVAGKTPDGYHLVVDVISEAIQADGGASW